MTNLEFIVGLLSGVLLGAVGTFFTMLWATADPHMEARRKMKAGRM